MTKMPGEGDIDTQHNGGQVCGDSTQRLKAWASVS